MGNHKLNVIIKYIKVNNRTWLVTNLGVVVINLWTLKNDLLRRKQYYFPGIVPCVWLDCTERRDWHCTPAVKIHIYLVWPQATNDKHPLKLIRFLFPLFRKNLMVWFLKWQGTEFYKDKFYLFKRQRDKRNRKIS